MTRLWLKITAGFWIAFGFGHIIAAVGFAYRIIETGPYETWRAWFLFGWILVMLTLNAYAALYVGNDKAQESLK